MLNLCDVLSNIIQSFKRYSITTLLPYKFPTLYEILPETRDFDLYERVWWDGEKWYIKSLYCTYYGDCKVWKLELENYPCKYSSHTIQYVDSREVKKIWRVQNVHPNRRT